MAVMRAHDLLAHLNLDGGEQVGMLRPEQLASTVGTVQAMPSASPRFLWRIAVRTDGLARHRLPSRLFQSGLDQSKLGKPRK